MLKLQEFYSIIILMKFKTQKSVTDQISSNNLNSMGFNSFITAFNIWPIVYSWIH
jgi:hypothetical protein